MEINTKSDVDKFLVVKHRNKIKNLGSFAELDLKELFSEKELKQLIIVFSKELFITHKESKFLKTKKFGLFFVHPYNLWNVLNKKDSSDANLSKGLLDQLGNFSLDSNDLIFGKTIDDITFTLKEQLNRRLPTLKVLIEKAINFQQTEHFETNTERLTREKDEESVTALLEEMYDNFEKFGEAITDEESYEKYFVEKYFAYDVKHEFKREKLQQENEKLEQFKLFEVEEE